MSLNRLLAAIFNKALADHKESHTGHSNIFGCYQDTGSGRRTAEPVPDLGSVAQDGR